MKTLFILLLIAVLATAYGWRHYRRGGSDSFRERTTALSEGTRRMAIEAKDAVSARIEEWNLTPENIRRELIETGRVVRTRVAAIGGTMEDARILVVIKGKYAAEKSLSVFDIGVECEGGEVKLSGSVDSSDQIGRAMALALNTTGVRTVVSRLSVKT